MLQRNRCRQNAATCNVQRCLVRRCKGENWYCGAAGSGGMKAGRAQPGGNKQGQCRGRWAERCKGAWQDEEGQEHEQDAAIVCSRCTCTARFGSGGVVVAVGVAYAPHVPAQCWLLHPAAWLVADAGAHSCGTKVGSRLAPAQHRASTGQSSTLPLCIGSVARLDNRAGQPALQWVIRLGRIPAQRHAALPVHAAHQQQHRCGSCPHHCHTRGNPAVA